MPYTRTAAGEAEVIARALPLSIPVRRLLGMIVGHQTREALAATSHLTELDRVLHDLVVRGLIVVSEPQTNASLPTVTNTPQKPSTLSASQLPEIKRAATRFVNDHLGPTGETAALRIERAADHFALMQALGEARDAIGQMRGRAVGEMFYQTIIAPIIETKAK
jgi:hypothetical protein